jgi:hypothetical protein
MPSTPTSGGLGGGMNPPTSPTGPSTSPGESTTVPFVPKPNF